MLVATVLVVDDIDSIREWLGAVLGLYGYAVLTAANVPEADAIRQRVGRASLDLVITDLRLTHVPHAREGADLIQRWHADTPQLPFILISGDVRLQEVGGLPRRVVQYLAKPFEVTALLSAVHGALGRVA
jgi:DNA-binding NtrC family response regulator